MQPTNDQLSLILDTIKTGTIQFHKHRGYPHEVDIMFTTANHIVVEKGNDDPFNADYVIRLIGATDGVVTFTNPPSAIGEEIEERMQGFYQLKHLGTGSSVIAFMDDLPVGITE